MHYSGKPNTPVADLGLARNRGLRLFRLGHELDLSGRRSAADALYRQTIELLEELSENTEFGPQVIELADLAFFHGRSLYDMGRFDSARLAFQRCREVLDSLLVLDAGYVPVMRLAVTLGWLARTQRRTGQFQEAIKSYRRAAALWKNLEELPQSADQQERLRHLLGCTLLGLSKTLAASGRPAKAKRIAAQAKSLLPTYPIPQ